MENKVAVSSKDLDALLVSLMERPGARNAFIDLYNLMLRLGLKPELEEQYLAAVKEQQEEYRVHECMCRYLRKKLALPREQWLRGRIDMEKHWQHYQERVTDARGPLLDDHHVLADFYIRFSEYGEDKHALVKEMRKSPAVERLLSRKGNVQKLMEGRSGVEFFAEVLDEWVHS